MHTTRVQGRLIGGTELRILLYGRVARTAGVTKDLAHVFVDAQRTPNSKSSHKLA
jgi:hypothetical protein